MWNSSCRVLWNSSIRIDWIKKNLLILLFFIIIYFFNRLFKSYINVYIIGYICRCHLNDFIGGIIFCIYTNMLLVLNNKMPINKISHLILFMLFVSLLWEYFFPLFLPYSTSDILDVFSYLLGTTIYYLLTFKIFYKKITH